LTFAPNFGQLIFMSKTYWEHYSHPADMGIRGFGPTKEQAFEQAALALTAITTDLEKVEPEEQVEISCEEGGDELLFAVWLNALIYEMATRGMLFSRFEVNIEGNKLHAKICGEKTATTVCLKCGKSVCKACHFKIIGVCKKCVPPEIEENGMAHIMIGKKNSV